MYREDFRPLLYTKLCRAMLQSPSDNIDPWKTLAQMVAEHLVREENFKKGPFTEEISTLKTMGLDANWRSENKTCLLYYMIKYGLVHGVRMLLKWGTTSEDVDGNSRSALQVAEDFKQPAIQKLLQEEGKCTSGKCIDLVPSMTQTEVLCTPSLTQSGFFCFFIMYHSFILHHLENRTRPISTP